MAAFTFGPETTEHKTESLKIPNVLLYVDYFTVHSWFCREALHVKSPLKEILSSLVQTFPQLVSPGRLFSLLAFCAARTKGH